MVAVAADTVVAVVAVVAVDAVVLLLLFLLQEFPLTYLIHHLAHWVIIAVIQSSLLVYGHNNNQKNFNSSNIYNSNNYSNTTTVNRSLVNTGVSPRHKHYKQSGSPPTSFSASRYPCPSQSPGLSQSNLHRSRVLLFPSQFLPISIGIASQTNLSHPDMFPSRVGYL